MFAQVRLSGLTALHALAVVITVLAFRRVRYLEKCRAKSRPTQRCSKVDLVASRSTASVAAHTLERTLYAYTYIFIYIYIYI